MTSQSNSPCKTWYHGTIVNKPEGEQHTVHLQDLHLRFQPTKDRKHSGKKKSRAFPKAKRGFVASIYITLTLYQVLLAIWRLKYTGIGYMRILRLFIECEHPQILVWWGDRRNSNPRSTENTLALTLFFLGNSLNNMPSFPAPWEAGAEDETSFPSNFSQQWPHPWMLKLERVSWCHQPLAGQKSTWDNFIRPFGKMTPKL